MNDHGDENRADEEWVYYFFSKKLLIPDNTMCSNILLRTEVKDIGR